MEILEEPALELELVGIWGSDRPGEDLAGETGLERREGRTGLGLAGTVPGEDLLELSVWSPVLKGLLETSLCWRSSLSGEARGGMGGLMFTLVGDSLGGRGGLSSVGEADFTVFTEAVEEMESELEVTLSLEGEIGDLLRPRSSELELSLPLTLGPTAGLIEIL